MIAHIEHLLAPPRSGKTYRCRQVVAQHLSENPEGQVLYASYSLEWSESCLCSATEGEWRPGGSRHFAAGPGTALCGRGFTLVILDDLIKDVETGNSITALQNILNWLTQSVACRLLPDARVFSISSEEQQMRMVVAVFGEQGVMVYKEPTSYDIEKERVMGISLYNRLYHSEPLFNLERT